MPEARRNGFTGKYNQGVGAVTDVEKALRGDHEAAKRVTEAGVLIPCPGCGKQNIKMRYVCGDHFSDCIECGWTGPMKNSEYEARLAWNTRAVKERKK